MDLSHTLGVVLIAILLDALIGDPAFVWNRLPHPVVLIGRLIGCLDRTLNTGTARRNKGVLALLLVILAAGLAGRLIVQLCALVSWGWMVEALCMAVLLAQKSLFQHVSAVARPLAHGDLAAARMALAKIVGRDVAVMNRHAVARAGIETLAENASDGVIAPLFWGALLGLPGMLVYKAVNTADSMIGHRDERYAEFGWAAARLDDVLNWVPARLTGWLIVLASIVTPETSARGGAAILRRDARKHASPNAGWPEAAAAGALGLSLGGPRSYDGEADDAPWMGDGRMEADSDDLARAHKLIVAAFALTWVAVLIVWLWLPR